MKPLKPIVVKLPKPVPRHPVMPTRRITPVQHRQPKHKGKEVE